jgi:hypothetical protein
MGSRGPLTHEPPPHVPALPIPCLPAQPQGPCRFSNVVPNQACRWGGVHADLPLSRRLTLRLALEPVLVARDYFEVICRSREEKAGLLEPTHCNPSHPPL